MPQQDYKRYSLLANTNGISETMPFVTLPVNSSDKYEYWNSSFSRLDKLANKYYGNPFYDFLILYANPSYTNEFDFPDEMLCRIPFPFAKAKADYESALKEYRNK